MATKSELHAAYENCEIVYRDAIAKADKLDFSAAVRCAEAAFPHQHAAVTYQRRFRSDTPLTTPALDLIFHYAPACFLVNSLDGVEKWYLGGTRAERSALPDFPAQLASARDVLTHALDIWGALAESPTAVIQPRYDPRTKALLQIWQLAGAVTAQIAENTAYLRVSDPRREVVGKCSTCGVELRARIAELLETTKCAACEKSHGFAIIRRS